MKCPHCRNIIKVRANVPKRGGVIYWLVIILFAFFVPLLFISIGTFMLFSALAPSFTLMGLCAGFFLALWIARLIHKNMLGLNDVEYAARFGASSTIVTHKRDTAGIDTTHLTSYSTNESDSHTNSFQNTSFTEDSMRNANNDYFFQESIHESNKHAIDYANAYDPSSVAYLVIGPGSPNYNNISEH